MLILFSQPVCISSIFKTKLLMSTGYYISINLDPFLQRFIKGYFNCYEIVFEFPKGEYLVNSLKVLLSPMPEEYKQRTYENEFRIHIPKSAKDPYTYNYLSATAELMFCKKIRDYFVTVFRERMAELRRAKYEKKESIIIFIDENKLLVDDFDRLAKDFQRWTNALNNKSYRKRRKSTLKNTKNVHSMITREHRDYKQKIVQQ